MTCQRTSVSNQCRLISSKCIQMLPVGCGAVCWLNFDTWTTVTSIHVFDFLCRILTPLQALTGSCPYAMLGQRLSCAPTLDIDCGCHRICFLWLCMTHACFSNSEDQMSNTPADIQLQLLFFSDSVANKFQQLADRLQRKAPSGPSHTRPFYSFSGAIVCEQCQIDALYDAVMQTRQALEDSI